MTKLSDIVFLADAREDTRANLAIAEHYCRLARGHLEIADDPVALMDIQSARIHFAAAIDAFKPVRRAMIEHGTALASEPSERAA